MDLVLSPTVRTVWGCNIQPMLMLRGAVTYISKDCGDVEFWNFIFVYLASKLICCRTLGHAG